MGVNLITRFHANRSVRAAVVAAMAGFGAVASASGALAVPLNPVQFNVTTVDAVADGNPFSVSQFTPVTGFGSFTASVNGASGSKATTHGKMSGGIDPKLDASIVLSNTGTPSAAAGSAHPFGVIYQFAVNGPGPTVSLSFVANGTLTTTALANQIDGQGSALLEFSVTGPGVNVAPFISCSVSTTACSQSFSGGLATFQTGQVYTVSIGTQMDASLFSSLTAENLTVHGTIDPQFFAPDNRYSFEFSPGLVNAAATPLPAALPLFVSGLGALAMFGWRRKLG
ncbi:MAG TPA: hypothetical protein VMT54_11855 [Candidatus Cybelea sp.]|nr:hypothetical protein [Candidatus Cybelea sp.]